LNEELLVAKSVRPSPLVTADDFYDEEKYHELLLKAAEEVLNE
jgi:hypothetical protein